MTVGEQLFQDAALTGDWQAAAIALRLEVQQLSADKAVLISSVEHAWSVVSHGAGEDPLQAFEAEVQP